MNYREGHTQKVTQTPRPEYVRTPVYITCTYLLRGLNEYQSLYVLTWYYQADEVQG